MQISIFKKENEEICYKEPQNYHNNESERLQSRELCMYEEDATSWLSDGAEKSKYLQHCIAD